MEINFKGLTLQIDVSNFYAGRKAFTSGLPEDCYEGEPAEVVFDIIGVEIDDPETLIEALYASFEEDIETLVIEEMGK